MPGFETTEEKKRRLVMRSRALRAQIGYQFVPVSHSVGAMESGMRILGRLRQHPEWVVGAVFALAILRPGRIAAHLRGLTLGLRSWQRLAPMLAPALAPLLTSLFGRR